MHQQNRYGAGTRRVGAGLMMFAALFTLTGMSGTECPDTTPGNGNNNGSCGTPVNSLPQITASDHVLGDANAPVTVFEYSDLQCPFCGRFDRNEFPDLMTNYIDTGKATRECIDGQLGCEDAQKDRTRNRGFGVGVFEPVMQ